MNMFLGMDMQYRSCQLFRQGQSLIQWMFDLVLKVAVCEDVAEAAWFGEVVGNVEEELESI